MTGCRVGELGGRWIGSRSSSLHLDFKISQLLAITNGSFAKSYPDFHRFLKVCIYTRFLKLIFGLIDAKRCSQDWQFETLHCRQKETMMKKLILTVLAMMALATASVHADVVTQWNFNNITPGDISTATPTTGSGLLSLLGGVTHPNTGSTGSGSSDTAATNLAFQTTTYAAQGADNNQRGVQFLVSTVGFSGVTVSWDTRHSNTSSAFQRFLYTVDGGANWIDDNIVFQATGGDTWFNNRTADLSSVATVNNNPNFGFRLVATFDSATGSYAASNPASNYAGGTLRFDMVTVNGIPEPGSFAVLAMVAGLAAFRRGKRT